MRTLEDCALEAVVAGWSAGLDPICWLLAGMAAVFVALRWR
jgi:hypothetical protein